MKTKTIEDAAIDYCSVIRGEDRSDVSYWVNYELNRKAFIAGDAHGYARAIDKAVTQDTSDGHHTFKELYDHRRALTKSLFNIDREKCFKSLLHDDGTMFDNYFIVGILTNQGYATYHYHKDFWHDFNCKELKTAPKWDGHDSQETIARIEGHFQAAKLSAQKELDGQKLFTKHHQECVELSRAREYGLEKELAEKEASYEKLAEAFEDLNVKYNSSQKELKDKDAVIEFATAFNIEAEIKIKELEKDKHEYCIDIHNIVKEALKQTRGES